jgi:hypothetical protein
VDGTGPTKGVSVEEYGGRLAGACCSGKNIRGVWPLDLILSNLRDITWISTQFAFKSLLCPRSFNHEVETGTRLLILPRNILKRSSVNMAVPKRVPWATLDELDELCTWIYSDDTDITRKQFAKNRVCKRLLIVLHKLKLELALCVAGEHTLAARTRVGLVLSQRHAFGFN